MHNITASNDTRKYLTDVIGDSYIDWEDGEFIFLSAHTGAGKSFFVMNTLLKHAISEGKTVSIFIPRNTLLKKYEFDLMKFLSFTSLDMDSLREYVTVSTYQNLENCIINGYEPKLGNYIICDEAHYFLSDSVFNVNTVLSYKYLTTHSPYSIKVLISATGERIFRYIKTKYSLPLHCSPEMTYNMPRKSYRIYDIPADYSYLDIMYLDESWNVVDLYNLDRDGKWAIFVDSISAGKTYYKKLTDAGISATFLCSENMHENIDEVSYITTLEKFSQQFLISTAVIETGVNFSDKNIRNIILLANTKERFIQMLGRRRIKDSYVGKCQLGSIKSSDLQKLISSKTSSLSYSSIKKIYELLKACFTHAVISKDLTHNPMDGVIMPKESVIAIKTKEISILSKEDIEAIHASAKATYSTSKPKYRYAYAYMLILNTGLRCGEALALTWDCIDFKKGTITVKKSVSTVQNREKKSDTKSIQVVGTVKTKQGNRIIPMNDVARKALLFYKDLREASKLSTELVIFTQTGKISQRGEFQRMLNKILGESHSEYIGIHALRHTFATNLLNSGADIKVISKLLGHSSVNITYNTYIHPSIDDTIDAVNLLNSRKIS